MLRIGYKPAFIREFKKLPAKLRQEANERISLFTRDPRHASLRIHKLHGALEGKWSFSVNYSYRIVCVFPEKKTAVLLAIGDHDIYR